MEHPIVRSPVNGVIEKVDPSMIDARVMPWNPNESASALVTWVDTK
jgi:hypothetical protein